MYECRSSSEIKTNVQVIRPSEEGSVQETSWDVKERWDSKTHSSEHPHKGDVDIQPGKKFMGRRGLW